MADARSIITPKFQLNRTKDYISLSREGILFRIFPRQLTFQLDRLENGSKESEEYDKILKTSTFVKKVYGVFGYLKLAIYSYLIVIEEASLIGQVLKANVYRAEKLLFVPLTNDASMQIDPKDQPYIDMIQKIQTERAFYFSYDMDLTKNIQTTLSEIQNQGQSWQNNGGANLSIAHQNQLLMRANFPNSIDYIPQFAFNHNLLGEFHGIEYAPFKVPCIWGYVFISSPYVSRSKIDFILISRKDCRRPGRRFMTRGLDREGNAANFAETEHIFVQYDALSRIKVATLVQIRGSIPLIWSMKPNLAWAPPVKVHQNFDDSRVAAELHFRETKDLFGSQYLVNLIDKKGSQKRLGEHFTKLYTELKDKQLHYVWFDFHGECKKMKWENLSKLVDICKEEIDNFGYFMANLNSGMNERLKFNDARNFTILQTQKGCFRTNCMDCLDRTNVVQGVFSRYVAFTQLNKMDLVDLPASGKISPFQKFPTALEEMFREGWTNNADVMSYLYTGTPALKTDFTRTGKRTHQGAINDGINSLTRYYINNFTDDYYVDCLNIATLKINAKSYKQPKSLLLQLQSAKLIMVIILVFLILNWTLGFFTGRSSELELQEVAINNTTIGQQ